jgi:ABC-2 type transport system ATP-binding protein
MCPIPLARNHIEVRNLSKQYGGRLAVDDLSFTVSPGTVTGFLGPNGAGKSTTMRVILGLDRPSAGTATIDGVAYADLAAPLRVVGALLEAGAVHPGRSAHDHLLYLAQTQAIPAQRVDQTLEMVGLSGVGRDRVGEYSLGMRQRLGIAAALLGDPQVLVLDEPVNGLDPDGIYWFRNLMKYLAGQGRTILVSSHLMAEMALTADNLVVIGRGRLIASSSTEEFIARNTEQSVVVRSPEARALQELLTTAGAEVGVEVDGSLTVRLLDAERIGDLAGRAGLVLHELTPQRASLEAAFMERTHDTQEFDVRDPALPADVDALALVPERSSS